MEYVPGAKTILEHVAARDLDLRARLRLFVRVCGAVAHGHRNKVIHRDLKPANILVDRGGEPKVIDFGIARAAEVDLSAQTLDTEAGRIVGTIQYMAPEQLDTRPVDLDPRCDVYALGTVLYKLLTGSMPHDLKGLPVFTAAEVIRNETPRRPSVVRAEIAGDLETIVLRAIAKDRNRRYLDAGSLGRDLLRYLADKPIHARRGGWVYRGRLFARRHRAAVAAVGVAVAVMAVAWSVVAWQWLRPQPDARAARERLAEVERERAALEAALAARPGPEPTGAPGPTPDPYVLDGHTESVACLAFGPDGADLLSGADDRTVIRWDLHDRAPRFTDVGHETDVRCLSLDAAGGRVATGARDGTVIVLDGAGGRAWRERQVCDGMRCLALAPGGDRLVVGSDDLALRFRSLEPGPRATKRLPLGAFGTAAFAPDGTMVATGADRGTVVVWSWAPGEARIEERWRLDGLEDRVVTVGFTGDGSSVVAAAADGAAMIWDLGDDPPRGRRFAALRGSIRAAAVDPAGRWLACARGRTFAVWDLAGPERVGSPIDHGSTISAIAIAPDGRWCALGEPSGRISVVPVR
jgi:WD40 repeat protein